MWIEEGEGVEKEGEGGEVLCIKTVGS